MRSLASTSPALPALVVLGLEARSHGVSTQSIYLLLDLLHLDQGMLHFKNGEAHLKGESLTNEMHVGGEANQYPTSHLFVISNYHSELLEIPNGVFSTVALSSLSTMIYNIVQAPEGELARINSSESELSF